MNQSPYTPQEEQQLATTAQSLLGTMEFPFLQELHIPGDAKQDLKECVLDSRNAARVIIATPSVVEFYREHSPGKWEDELAQYGGMECFADHSNGQFRIGFTLSNGGRTAALPLVLFPKLIVQAGKRGLPEEVNPQQLLLRYGIDKKQIVPFKKAINHQVVTKSDSPIQLRNLVQGISFKSDQVPNKKMDLTGRWELTSDARERVKQEISRIMKNM